MNAKGGDAAWMANTQRDYWLSLAVYDDFRGVPVRKVLARGYLDIGKMDQLQQAMFIRLGSLFFQGRSWRKFAGVATPEPETQLTDQDRVELEQLRSVRRRVGAAVVRLLDDDETLDPIKRDVTIERLEAMGFLEGDYKI